MSEEIARMTAESGPWLESLLRQAWAARQFHVEYQPQVNLRDRKVVRFEALLRWDCAGKGAISPKDFIPVAERLGIIGEIGQWVLEQACEDALSWPEDVGIAVNVSAMSLQDDAFPALVQHAILRTGLAPARLELEITETAALILDSGSLKSLSAIQKLGVRITIDDLDVGHASLRHLLFFPFDKIKVDGIYADAIGRTDRRGDAARQIMRLVANLCENLNMVSLSEGVETAEQLAVVMEANFTEVQGFIFGESVAADQASDLIRHIEGNWEKLVIPQPVSSAPRKITADRDQVTGIPNRQAFLKAIEAEIAYCRQAAEPGAQLPLCVAWIDVDHIKDINDSLGRAAGDAILVDIADRLTENMRRRDAIGRLGSEELAVCMPAMKIKDASGFADRLRRAVATAGTGVLEQPAPTTISVGIAELLPEEDAASLLARADAAMLEARRAGGNQVRSAA